jgi:hypothetical protein
MILKWFQSLHYYYYYYCTDQILVYADVNILEESVHIIKENSEAFVLASKEIGL